MEVTKNISYLGKDFSKFRKNLIDFTKQYFPNTYSDFNESDPGTMLLELSAYVGDVLSYYADNNLQESLLDYASERANIYNLARTLGYVAKNAVPAYVDLDVYQLVPAIGTGDNIRPDYTYALSIRPGMRVLQESGPAAFRTIDSIDFAVSSSFNPTEVTIYETDDTTNLPIYYLLKKSVRAVSGTVKTATFTFDSPVPYDKIVLPDTKIIDIISVEESDGDNWYQVPYLGQDTLFEEVPNLIENDPELSQYRNDVPSLLKLRKTAKRFVTRLRSDNKLELQFGPGISDNNDEEVIPNPENVGNGLAGFRRPIDVDIDPSNFLYTRAYGQAPANTTLTVTYSVGQGITDNAAANTIKKIDYVDFINNPNSNLSNSVLNYSKQSLAINNSEAAIGAKPADSLIDIKTTAVTNFATQNRSVTLEDYIVRCYSMPAKFGSVAKAYIVPDDQLTQQQFIQQNTPNPFAMNLYLLGYNENKQLVTLNRAIKENLQTYLGYYRILTDAINITDAFIINLSLNFKITVLANYNSNDVLIKCISNLKDYFNIDRWQINQPIIKSEVINVITNTPGVQNTISVTMTNKFDTEQGYSGNQYDLDASTRNGIVYPSLDPSIFEIKFPNSDITGQVISY